MYIHVRIASIATSGEKPNIIIFDLKTLKKKKTLNTSNSNEYDGIFGNGCISLQITEDERTLIALSDKSNITTNSNNNNTIQSLSIWNWPKSKLITSFVVSSTNSNYTFRKISIYSIPPTTNAPTTTASSSNSTSSSNNNTNNINTIICVYGDSIIHFYSYTDTTNNITLLYEHLLKNDVPTCCTWLTGNSSNYIEHCIIGTNKGDLLIFNKNRLLFRVSALEIISQNSMNTSNISSLEICSLVTYRDIIIIGTSDGYLYFYQFTISNNNSTTNNSGNSSGNNSGNITQSILTKSQIQYIHNINITDHLSSSTTLTTTTPTSIICLAITPNATTLTMLTSDRQICSIRLPIHLLELSPEDIYYTTTPTHRNNILSIDICSRKPLLVSYSEDHTLKLINYKTHNILLTKDLLEDAYAITLHPSGLHIVIAYHDKVRIYHILVEEIKLCKEVSVKACKQCSFSPGGRLLALAHGSMISVLGKA